MRETIETFAQMPRTIVNIIRLNNMLKMDIPDDTEEQMCQAGAQMAE